MGAATEPTYHQFVILVEEKRYREVTDALLHDARAEEWNGTQNCMPQAKFSTAGSKALGGAPILTIVQRQRRGAVTQQYVRDGKTARDAVERATAVTAGMVCTQECAVPGGLCELDSVDVPEACIMPEHLAVKHPHQQFFHDPLRGDGTNRPKDGTSAGTTPKGRR